jgi:hypothetical protein
MQQQQNQTHNPCDTRVNCRRQMTPVVPPENDLFPADSLAGFGDSGFDLQLPPNWQPPYKDLREVLQPDYTVACIGRRGTGKSFMIRWIVYFMRDRIPRWFVFTNTKMNRFFMDQVGMPDKVVFPKFSIPVLRKIISEQKTRVEKARLAELEGDDVDWDSLRIGVILDDIGSDKGAIRNSQEMDDIFYHGRHSLVFFIISEQYFKLVGPGARKNIDIPILFCPDSEDEALEMIKQYLGFLPKKEARKMLWTGTRPEPLLDEHSQPLLDEDGRPEMKPIAISRDTRQTAKVGHPIETMFRTGAEDPPPYISCDADVWCECQESADTAMEHAQTVYLNRKSKLHPARSVNRKTQQHVGANRRQADRPHRGRVQNRRQGAGHGGAERPADHDRGRRRANLNKRVPSTPVQRGQV